MARVSSPSITARLLSRVAARVLADLEAARRPLQVPGELRERPPASVVLQTELVRSTG